MSQSTTHAASLNLRDQIVGIDTKVPLLDGRKQTYVNLDNAASTPSLKSVTEALEQFMPFYSSVHRGTGFKSRLSTEAYDQAHEIIAEFVGANLEDKAVIFTKNTTEAINKLSYRLGLKEGDVVMTTRMEHHSNDLPWRDREFDLVYIDVTPDGRLDEADFDRKLKEYKGRLKLVSVTGASNVSGFIQPIHRMARKTHEAGALILVDAAQLAPHRRVDMKDKNAPDHLDFVALSGHKMYAPYGTGALIGPRKVFLASGPEYRGGGTVDMVSEDEVWWAGLPDRDEAGSPNVVGAIAMAVAAQQLMEVGMDLIETHEEILISYALEQLKTVPGVTIYGETDPQRAKDKVGVIPFNLEGYHHALLAAILGYEGGIGVRSGCFCAHPYVVHLLDLNEEEAEKWREQLREGDKSDMPGMLRMSFGCYNTTDDVDKLVDMLRKLSKGEYKGNYELIPSSGEYKPIDFEEPFKEYFSLK